MWLESSVRVKTATISVGAPGSLPRGAWNLASLPRIDGDIIIRVTLQRELGHLERKGSPTSDCNILHMLSELLLLLFLMHVYRVFCFQMNDHRSTQLQTGIGLKE